MEEDFVLIKYSLTEALKVCERRGIKIGFEMHQTYSLDPDHYDKCLNLVDSPNLSANYDTGNAHLGGHDAVEWFDRIKAKCIHVHAKDISIEKSDAERGKVMGTAENSSPAPSPPEPPSPSCPRAPGPKAPGTPPFTANTAS
jgi:sugar phosphate isomerase/epimerase